jgi:predicted DNA-binding ribbon-helix-helix protein
MTLAETSVLSFVIPDLIRDPCATASGGDAVAVQPITGINYHRAMPDLSDTLPPDGFAGPVKRSITIAGHQTSISLEPAFWAALEAAARRHGLPLSALVAELDARRVAQRRAPNLASYLRSWLFHAADVNRSQ